MTPYGATILLIVVVLIVAVAVLISLRRAERRNARLPIGGLDAIVLKGRGAASSKALDLRAGHYRLEYRFSEEWATAVYLVSATSGDRDFLVYKTGAGSAPFEIMADEQVIVEVEPTADQVEWRLEIVYRAGRTPDDVVTGPLG